ncbi:MAG: hypothetical protein II820_05410 [Ruminiclostridium sp.]|nr:hypothetical protein [Ruminiclostridium sp.]
MNGFVKAIKNHATAIICTVLLIGLVYGMFMLIFGVGNYTTVRDSYDSFFRNIEGKLGAISVISDYEISQRDPQDTENRAISAQGEYPDLRDMVFTGDIVPVSAETYKKADSGKCGALYRYSVEGVEFLIRYEKGIKNESDASADGNTDNFEYYGEDIKIIKP